MDINLTCYFTTRLCGELESRWLLGKLNFSTFEFIYHAFTASNYTRMTGYEMRKLKKFYINLTFFCDKLLLCLIYMYTLYTATRLLT